MGETYLNVGLVGCGRVSDIHMNAYKNIPEANVIAIADINLDRARAFAQKWRIPKVYDDALKLFEMKNLDFVDICTPISTHAKLACEAAKYGHNIFLEKPMARSSKECDQIIHEISKNAGTIISLKPFKIIVYGLLWIIDCALPQIVTNLSLGLTLHSEKTYLSRAAW